MLEIKITENYAGIEVKGDYNDFDKLYDCIFEIVGDEEEYPTLEKFRIQILALCYDLRHAKQGSREIELIPNNIDEEIMKYHSIIAPTNNVYYKFNYILTQAIFVVYVLNIFIDNHKYKKYKSSHYTRAVYDEDINIVQEFQSKVIKAIVEILPEKNQKSFLKLFYDREFGTNRFIHQYLELIDCRYLAKNKDERLKSILNTTKRVIKYWEYQEYIDLEQELLEYAEENQCNIDNIRITGTEYPESIEW